MSSEKEKVKNILIVAITRMGDMLQATPMISGLRTSYPNAKITVLIEKNFVSICHGIPGIDEVVEINLSMVVQCIHREREGIIDAFKYVSDIVDDLKSRKFDFCINMSSSAYTALLLKLVNAGDNRGWVSDDEGFRIISNPWAMLFAAFVYHSNRDYNSINLVDIFRCQAGVDTHPLSLVYKVPDEAKDFAAQFLRESGVTGNGPLITVQAGASQEKRQWSPARFAKVAEMLIREHDAQIVFTGTQGEMPIIEKIFGHYNHSNMAIAAGKTNLNQLSGLLEASKLLITGDTGTMHLSVAVGTPVVSLFLASALCFETGPYGPGNIVVQPQIACNPCNPNLPCSNTECHDQIPPELISYLCKLRIENTDEQLLSLQIPKTVADPRVAAVYVTHFDEDRFLDFKQINGRSTRTGFPAEYYIAARETYRHLWKSEFGATNRRAPGAGNRDQMPGLVKVGLRGILSQTEEAARLLDRLTTLILDHRSAPSALGETMTELNKVEKEIEKIGLSTGIFGAIVRMFVMEKENMRGSDPYVLAQEMKQLYSTLAHRCEEFGGLFAYHYQRLQEQRV